jgi:hypothetical protein
VDLPPTPRPNHARAVSTTSQVSASSAQSGSSTAVSESDCSELTTVDVDEVPGKIKSSPKTPALVDLQLDAEPQEKEKSTRPPSRRVRKSVTKPDAAPDADVLGLSGMSAVSAPAAPAPKAKRAHPTTARKPRATAAPKLKADPVAKADAAKAKAVVKARAGATRRAQAKPRAKKAVDAAAAVN